MYSTITVEQFQSLEWYYYTVHSYLNYKIAHSLSVRYIINWCTYRSIVRRILRCL